MLYPCNYLSRECCLYKAGDLLLGVRSLMLSSGYIVHDYHLLPARASEQGNVIGLVSVYIYIYVYKKICN